MMMLRIGAVRGIGLSTIDQAAAQARQRHITGLAGQDMVYTAKLAQAQAYIAAHAVDTDAVVPGYVAAEVAAAGGTALQAAQAIVAAADAFHSGPGPQIEQARRAGKLAVASAATQQAVEAATASALQALQTI